MISADLSLICYLVLNALISPRNFPLAEKKRQLEKLPPGKRILVVDDHALFRSGLRLILESRFPHIAISEASTLGEAFAGSEPPALVLLDLVLNGANTLDLLEMIRMLWPSCPIIIVSADDRAETKALALARGATAYVDKSSGGEVLLETVSRHLGVLDPPAPPDVADKQVLSIRQMEVLHLMHQGLSNKGIARILELSEFTVRGHVQSILKIMGVNSRSAAVFAALKSGFIK